MLMACNVLTASKRAAAVAGLFLAMMPQEGLSIPQYLADQCSRSLTIGELIMGLPVASGTEAPVGQVPSFSITDSDGNDVTCDGSNTVTQGDSLVIQIESTLIDAIADSAWSTLEGPNAIVEAEGGLLVRDDLDTSCAGTRMVNPNGPVTLRVLDAGGITIRMLSAYSYGQVYAADVCQLDVSGSKELATVSGFVVDSFSWNEEGSPLATAPYDHTVQTLMDQEDSGYLLLEQSSSDPDTFASKYTLDEEGNTQVAALLQSIFDSDGGERSNVQVTVVGFVDGDELQVLSVASCLSSSTCEGYYSPPVEESDGLCLDAGLCIESSVVDEEEGIITVTMSSNDGSWFGIGFSTPGGGMTGGGSGADIVVCSAEGLRRFWVTGRSNPGGFPTETFYEGQGGDEILNSCSFEGGTGRMVFTRTLVAENGNQRSIVQGQEDSVIWARGAGERELISKHDRKGQVRFDITDIENAILRDDKLETEWILWLHIIFMAIAWGIFLPMGAAIANRLRCVEGAPKGAWFRLHKIFQRIGWTLQLVGLICALYYCELYSVHLEHTHTKIGVTVIVIGTLQPLNALLRPHETCKDSQKSTARIIFEIIHKGLGWAAIGLGMSNIFSGASLANDLNFENTTRTVPLVIGSIGLAIFVIFMGLSIVMPNNPINKLLTGANANNIARAETEKQAAIKAELE